LFLSSLRRVRPSVNSFLVPPHHPPPEKTSSDEIGKPCSISYHDHARCQKKHRARAQDDIERARPAASSEVFENARPMFFREQGGGRFFLLT